MYLCTYYLKNIYDLLLEIEITKKNTVLGLFSSGIQIVLIDFFSVLSLLVDPSILFNKYLLTTCT